MNSITDEGNLDSNPFKFLSETEAEIHWSALMQTKADSVARRFSSIPHPNILLITWESLTSKALNRKFEEVSVLPCLERRLKEGIFFDNAFASGDRTDKGIVSILSGYPAQPITSIVKMPEKTRTLPHLPSLLKKEGYQTSFYYGGETEFANMKSYLLGAGFDKITDVKNFEAKERNSKWGAHDHVVMNKIKKDIQSTGRPFFIHWLTLSSHEPFETGAEASLYRQCSGASDQLLQSAALVERNHNTNIGGSWSQTSANKKQSRRFPHSHLIAGWRIES
jgi:phosphoglycerol transferase MdoB-like AlkP superfamily enzyme